MIKINEKKMKESGFDFDSMDEILWYIDSIVDYLYTHNKNYTKEQYRRIDILFTIKNFLEVE